MLGQQVGTGGGSLSVGERQLLAIARVLLRASSGKGCKVCVMDEPTAHIDAATDAVLQRVMRKKFTGATLVTIAHRLHTVADFDTLLVLDQGRLAEQGPPLALLARPHGAFRAMVDALGPEAAASIEAKARGVANGSLLQTLPPPPRPAAQFERDEATPQAQL
jgi:ABC-type multidrug transport system fused ATPase/permease subunit